MSSLSARQQQSLPLIFDHALSWEDFVVGENLQVVETLKHFTPKDFPRGILLVGQEGVGKSLLLKVLCHTQDIPYVDLKQRAILPASGDFNHSAGAVCIDHLEGLQGSHDQQFALFAFLNQLYDQDCCPVMASTLAPKQLADILPDLASRLSWGLTLRVAPLNEVALLQALKQVADKQGMMLSDEVAHFLLARVERSLPALVSVMDILAQASLEQQRKLTIPLVKSVLHL